MAKRIDTATFKPNTVYVTIIAATPEKVWQALTGAEFTKQYFGGQTVEVESKAGGSFVMRMPDGSVNVKGEVVEWSPPRRFSCTWGFPQMPRLPECLVTYDIEPLGDAVKLTMTEAHSWDIPEALLSGGRQGWPAILSSLKSLLETGKPLAVKIEPPKAMIQALKAFQD